MRTVKEVSRLTGVSVRTLQYYDRIGLLCPACRTQAGYRLYDQGSLERLQQILLFRELGFPLKEIGAILDSPGFDREKALEQQIALLELQKERLEGILSLAREIQKTGVIPMEFSTFDTSQIDAYRERVRKQWGRTPEFAEFEERSQGRSREQEQEAAAGLMDLFAGFGALRSQGPASPEAQRQVKALQDYITAHFYRCTDQVLSQLGELYASQEFTASIDRAGGAGTASFVREAIRLFCGQEA